ncbi:MAG: DUF309 domain-containing protein, partial [Planctomycetaceae bacterium]|nr:DUF309 domain-containing protein [Planctomycetaceae bacterium]
MSDGYAPQYLEGLRLFNEEEFFEAHDVWEELWSESLGDEKKFLQGLIQASVSLFHFGNENFKLTYGFCSKDLLKFLNREKSRICVKVDQHMAAERNSKGNYYCKHLGAAC